LISFSDLMGNNPSFPFSQNQIWTIAGEDGTPIISFKSLLKAEYGSNGTVVSEPIEQNSFASYNKTTEPREYHFELALQMPNNDFSSALAKLERLKIGTELFSFVNPFMTFYDLSLEGYSTVFETSTSMMVVALDCKEVKQVQQGYTNVTVNDATPITQGDAANPDSTDTVDTGMTGTSEGTTEEKEKASSTLYDVFGKVSLPGFGG